MHFDTKSYLKSNHYHTAKHPLKAMCKLAWKLFLPKEQLNLDHPAANPLNSES
jgi:hypothetical protein